MENASLIRSALCLMLDRPRDEGPFVLIKRASGTFVVKYVRFVRVVGTKPLFLDLPSDRWSEAEYYRAAAYFKKHGVAGEQDWFDKEGEPTFPEEIFCMVFDSVDKATEVALDIFDEVYGLPRNLELTVETSWET